MRIKVATQKEMSIQRLTMCDTDQDACRKINSPYRHRLTMATQKLKMSTERGKMSI